VEAVFGFLLVNITNGSNLGPTVASGVGLRRGVYFWVWFIDKSSL